MQEPRAVEIIHEQSQDKDLFRLKRYWTNEILMTSEWRSDLIQFANKNKLIICTRPAKRELHTR